MAGDRIGNPFALWRHCGSKRIEVEAVEVPLCQNAKLELTMRTTFIAALDIFLKIKHSAMVDIHNPAWTCAFGQAEPMCRPA